MTCEDMDCRLELTKDIDAVKNCSEKKLSKNHYIVWTACILVFFVSAIVALDRGIGKCASKSEIAVCLMAINAKLDKIGTDVTAIKVSQENTEEYIAETKVRDTKQDDDIKELQLENARGHD